MRLISNLAGFKNFLSEINGGFYICGAGKYGRCIGEYAKTERKFIGYFDGKKIGEDILPYERVIKEAYYLISTITYRNQIEAELRNNGIPDGNIWGLDGNGLIVDILCINNNDNRVLTLRDIYHGKRCFIVGNGPSLKLEDLEKIKNEYSFACNSIHKVFEQTVWRPSFYFSTDSTETNRILSSKKISELINKSKTSFFLSKIYYNQESIKNAYYMVLRSGVQGENIFSTQCEKSVFSVGSVSYEMLQMAIYMGFTEIYLLGMDFTFSVEKKMDGTIIENNVKNHMDLMGEEDIILGEQNQRKYGLPYFAETDMQLWGYESAKKYAETNGIKICNATRGGKLEVFERVDFDSLF